MREKPWYFFGDGGCSPLDSFWVSLCSKALLDEIKKLEEE